MLVIWHFKVLFYKLWENLWIFRHLYKHSSFRKVDLQLKKSYLFQSPYRIARRNKVLYGHTPLPTMKRILDTCLIQPGSQYLDLGCGEGRAAIYTHFFYEQKVTAVDLISKFIQKANSIALSPDLNFQCRDILELDFSKMEVVYFFATGFDEAFLNQLGEKLQHLPKGAKVITVSEPLSAFTKKGFYLWKQFESFFYFGNATVFCQIKR